MSTPVEPDMLNSRMSCRKNKILPSVTPLKNLPGSLVNLRGQYCRIAHGSVYTSETKRRIPNDGNYDDVNIGFDY